MQTDGSDRVLPYGGVSCPGHALLRQRSSRSRRRTARPTGRWRVLQQPRTAPSPKSASRTSTPQDAGGGWCRDSRCSRRRSLRTASSYGIATGSSWRCRRSSSAGSASSRRSSGRASAAPPKERRRSRAACGGAPSRRSRRRCGRRRTGSSRRPRWQRRRAPRRSSSLARRKGRLQQPVDQREDHEEAEETAGQHLGANTGNDCFANTHAR